MTDISSRHLRATCPSCKVALRMPARMLGRSATCPKCGSQFRVPSRPAPAPPPESAATGPRDMVATKPSMTTEAPNPEGPPSRPARRKTPVVTKPVFIVCGIGGAVIVIVVVVSAVVVCRTDRTHAPPPSALPTPPPLSLPEPPSLPVVMREPERTTTETMPASAPQPFTIQRSPRRTWNSGSLAVTEESLGILPEHVVNFYGYQEVKHVVPASAFCVSHDSRRVAFVARAGDRPLVPYVVVVDGVPQTPYRGIQHVTFSPDSRHVAYVARISRTETPTNATAIVLDGREGRLQDSRGVSKPIFAPDSTTLAYVLGSSEIVAWDGKSTERSYEEVAEDSIVFSPNSRRLAYMALERGQAVLVVDGKARPLGGKLVRPGLLFSPDSRHLAYVLHKGGGGMEADRLCVVSDGVETKLYTGVAKLTFSEDSKHVAYAANTMGRTHPGWFICIDEKEYETIGDFDPESLTIDPTSTRMAYVIRDRRWAKCAAVVEGVKGPQYDDIGRIMFSSDGRHVAYVAKSRGMFTVVVDSIEGSHYTRIDESTFCFSPDNRRFAYQASSQGKLFVVLDGDPRESSDNFPGLCVPLFSPDSRDVAYFARSGDNYCIVVGKERVGQYDGLIEGAKVVWDDASHLHTVAFRDRELFRVSIETMR